MLELEWRLMQLHVQTDRTCANLPFAAFNCRAAVLGLTPLQVKFSGCPSSSLVSAVSVLRSLARTVFAAPALSDARPKAEVAWGLVSKGALDAKKRGLSASI